MCALNASTKPCSAGPALSRNGFAAGTTTSFASVPTRGRSQPMAGPGHGAKLPRP
jgi:hypothetical protein